MRLALRVEMGKSAHATTFWIDRGSYGPGPAGALLRLSPSRLCAAALAAVLLVAGTVPSFAQLPTLGDGSDMTSGAERKLGERIAREMYRDPDYIDDPVLI